MGYKTESISGQCFHLIPPENNRKPKVKPTNKIFEYFFEFLMGK